MRRQCKPPSQTWRTFLENHVKSLVSVDFCPVPTIRFQVLYVFLVLAHNRRRILRFGVTAHPTVEWTVQQLRYAFPWETAPGYLLRDRDRIFGTEFVRAGASDGNQTRAVSTTVTVATGLRGTRHRLDSPRMPRPCDCFQSELSPPHSLALLSLLPSLENSSVAAQRCSGNANGTTANSW